MMEDETTDFMGAKALAEDAAKTHITKEALRGVAVPRNGTVTYWREKFEALHAAYAALSTEFLALTTETRRRQRDFTCAYYYALACYDDRVYRKMLHVWASAKSGRGVLVPFVPLNVSTTFSVPWPKKTVLQ